MRLSPLPGNGLCDGVPPNLAYWRSPIVARIPV